jgi:hypothetical protein
MILARATSLPANRVKIWSVLAILASTLFLFLSQAALAQEMINVTPKMLAELRQLQPHLTFAPDLPDYTGVRDLEERTAADRAFANLVNQLVIDLPTHPDKSFVLRQFSSTLYRSGVWETEDRERAATYCEEIMKVVGIKSSDDLLNRYLYGHAWWLVSQWFVEHLGSVK